MSMRTNTIKRALAIVIVGAISLGCIAGCGKKKEEPVIITEDDIRIREALVSAIDTTKASESFTVSNSGSYTFTARVTANSYQVDATATDDYTNYTKYVKDVGTLISSDSTHTTTLKSVIDNNSTTESEQSSFISYFDTQEKMFYYSLNNDTSQWFKTEFDLSTPMNEFLDIIRNADVKYTMEQTGNETKISCDLRYFFEIDSVKAYREKYEEDIGTMTPFLSVLLYSESGMVTVHIDSNNRITQINFNDLYVGDDNTKCIAGDPGTMLLTDSSITGSFTMKFVDYNGLDSDSILLYEDKMRDAVLRTEDDDPYADTTTPTDANPIDSVVVYAKDGLTDTNNVDSYPVNDLSMNNMNLFGLSSENKCPFNINVFEFDDWSYDSDDGAYFKYVNSKYPDTELRIWSSTENGVPFDEFNKTACGGFIMDVSQSVLNNTRYPDFRFTSVNIPFGSSASFILDRYGRPDVAIIDEDYDTYQYVMYQYEGVTREKMSVYMISFKIYHTETLQGNYGIEIQYYIGE